ncbi:mycothiol synthase [Corynebacterium confusum]|uniref:mycothiol synthase n=1 Tax=Corynebacterium confusum TaxID=71254 RepID=UPI0025B5BC5D|nr:mycothiol synthase [Corynebacterium confusum]WJY90421.1 Mycothiol acetyltransferase [Corynebacterium confusum]
MTATSTKTTHLPDDAATARAVAALARDAAQADGVAPLSEQFLAGLEDARLGHTHTLLWVGEDLAGVAADDGDSAELFVAPDYRGHGGGKALLAELGDRPVWAHGNLPAAQHLVTAAGRAVERELLVMAVQGDLLSSAAAFSAVDAPGLQSLDYPAAAERFGAAAVDRAWLAVNNEAFSWHPEQGGWDAERLERGKDNSWFDPADVLFLWDTRGAEPTLAGFHWTKWHSPATTEEDESFGEVYVIGLAASYRGQGLSRPLLALGLQRMQDKGADKVILYVEADNAAAVRSYEKAGFEVAERHCVYGVKNG